MDRIEIKDTKLFIHTISIVCFIIGILTNELWYQIERKEIFGIFIISIALLIFISNYILLYKGLDKEVFKV